MQLSIVHLPAGSAGVAPGARPAGAPGRHDPARRRNRLTLLTAAVGFAAARSAVAVPSVDEAGSVLVGSGTLAYTAAASHDDRELYVLNGTPTLAGSPGDWTSRLDVANNDLDIQSGRSAATAAANLATVTSEVAQGYDLTRGANWQGSGGITSTTAAADTNHLTALGVIQNNQSGAPLYGSSTPFDTFSPLPGDTLVKYTYFGDANLDGKVDGSDYSLIDAGYASHGTLTGWYYGDFNYDGVIDGSDYALIDNAFNNQTVNLSTSAVVAASTAQPAAVPEPAGFVFVAFAGLQVLPQRRSRSAKVQRMLPAR